MEKVEPIYHCQNPVVLIVFNRPEKTRGLLKILSHVTPQKVYIISDGPRENNANDAKNVKEVRGIIESHIDWDCQIHRIYADENMSGPIRVPSALNEIFSIEEQVIILEDDCHPNLSFFPFIDELLIKYKNDNRIGTICGFNTEFNYLGFPIDNKRSHSYFFSTFPSSWGWATWKRVWDKFDFNVTDANIRLEDGTIRNWLPNRAKSFNYWKRIFTDLHSGKRRNWDYKLVYALVSNKLLTVVPNVNLVDNNGLSDGSGTNFKKSAENYIERKQAKKMSFPLSHPHTISKDKSFDLNMTRHFFSSSYVDKAMWFIRNFIVKLR